MKMKKITYLSSGQPTIALTWPATQDGPAGQKMVTIVPHSEIPVRDDYELWVRIGGCHWVMSNGQKIVDAHFSEG